MTNKNDQLYITRVINGDTNAFAYLVDNYKDMIYKAIMKFSINVFLPCRCFKIKLNNFNRNRSPSYYFYSVHCCTIISK